MSRSKLGQSLMRTIDGGKAKGESAVETVINDAFEQAEMNIHSTEFNDAGAEAYSSNEPHVDFDEIHSSGEPEPQIDKKPLNMKAPKKRKTGGFMSAIALLVSIGALGVAGYAVISQKSGQQAALKSAESLDVAIGHLNTRADEITADLSGTKKSVQSNSDRLISIDGIRKDLQILNTTVSAMHSELDGLKGKLEANTTLIDKHQQQISELNGELKLLNARAASAPKRVIQKAPVQQERTDPSEIEGAYVASIDIWGTQLSVMLREINGNWIPLTTGDYYKGWRLEGADDFGAVFQQGTKTKRLTVKE